jgi:hypothetical protein
MFVRSRYFKVIHWLCVVCAGSLVVAACNSSEDPENGGAGGQSAIDDAGAGASGGAGGSDAMAAPGGEDGGDGGHEHEFDPKTPAEVGLDATCWTAELACNPLTNTGCDEHRACDVGQDEHGDTVLLCFEDEHAHEEDGGHAEDGGHTEDAGHEHDHEHCHVVDDPACPAGHHCVGSPEGVCVELCCSDDDCGADEACEALGNEGTLGVCQPVGDCGGVGEACSGDDAECCSGICHVDHCD